MVIIVTGTIGIGKTTVCQKVIKIARNQGHSCGGVVTYKKRNENIVIEEVQTGAIEVLASICNRYHGPRTEKYFFNPEGIDFGIKAIAGAMASDILVVDELGHLELRGQGFAEIIEPIATRKIKTCILAIRKELVSSYLPQLGTTISIFETTIENRNQLPEEISLTLI